MKELEKYLSPLDREVLELVAYHKSCLAQLLIDPAAPAELDAQEKLRLLNEYKKTVVTRAIQRKEIEDVRNERRAEFMKSRLIATCPECNTDREVRIVGEHLNERYGWKCDEVECTECKHSFINYLPNNETDRMHFYDNFITQMLTVRDDGSTIADKLDSKANIPQLVEHYKLMKQRYREAEESENQFNQATMAVDKCIEDIRNFLLLAKVNAYQWDANLHAIS